MKKPPSVIIIDNNITNIFLVPPHNYTNKINILGVSPSLIFNIGSVATIIWSDDSKNFKIQEGTIIIVMRFNSFIQKACE